ncbi:hypothetical protein HMPREF9554_03153 [Treponema phagedenis F0421]|nr:hypothetical protein HMPREF9554_03153 [Treponema phagedenis F0421]
MAVLIVIFGFLIYSRATVGKLTIGMVKPQAITVNDSISITAT